MSKIYYVIGDVHGRDKEFETLLSLVEADMQKQPSENDIFLIQIGDLIDRGPASKAVVERCMALETQFPKAKVVVIKGNHEQALLDAYEKQDEHQAHLWFRHAHGHGGGIRTLESYGAMNVEDSPKEIIKAVQKYIPQNHINYLTHLPTSFADGNYFFAHAGVDPEVPLSEQKDDDLIDIRHPFLMYEKPFEKVIVHGHTPRRNGEILPNRVNTDAGAGYGLHLKCFILPETYVPEQVRVLAVTIEGIPDWDDSLT